MRACNVLLIMASLILSTRGVPSAAEPGNDRCLSCHGNRDIIKMGGERLLVDPVRFAATTHSFIGCKTCHDSVTPQHPHDGVRPSKASCRECHAPIQAEYSKSLHGSKAACNDCHNPHEVKSPIAVSGDDINAKCARCHGMKKTVKSHSKWLPQADLHIEALPCITCHTGSKNYFISMYIVKGKNGSRFGKQEVAGYHELKKLAAGGDIVSLIDANGDNYVSLQELRNFNSNNSHRSLHLQGMMTPETVTHKFEILDNRRNCTFCHTSGPGAMQTSFIAVPVENGTFIRVAVEKGAVLDALYGTPDFYMMGSTKNSKLNGIGLAIICGGLIMPVGHGFLRFLTRKNRKGKEHQS